MTVIAADAFTRTGTNGWGTADTGGTWTVSNGTYFSTNGSRGVITSNAGSTAIARLGSVSSTTTDVTVSVGASALPVGGSTYHYVHARSIADSASSSTAYGALAIVGANGAVSLYLRINGTSSMLTATGLTIAASDRLNIRVRTTGSSPTRIQAKVWKAGTTEPTAWAIDTTDSTSGLQVAGGIALGNYTSSTATNTPISITWDGLSATDGATANVAPTVSAGADQPATAGQTITLRGTASDADGSIASTAWTCTAFPTGGAPTITSPASLTTTVSGLIAGNYTFQLTATDNAGATTSDTCAVPVAATAVTPPTLSGAIGIGRAVIDVRGSTGTGSLTYSCSPAPLETPVPGYFVVAQTTSVQPFRITATDSTTGASVSQAFNVPALTSVAPYDGQPIVLVLPQPGDPATQDVWGQIVNAAFDGLREAGNGLIDHYNGN